MQLDKLAARNISFNGATHYDFKVETPRWHFNGGADVSSSVTKLEVC